MLSEHKKVCWCDHILCDKREIMITIHIDRHVNAQAADGLYHDCIWLYIFVMVTVLAVEHEKMETKI